MKRRRYFRANGRRVKKLCDEARFLADYLNIDIDPHDFGYELSEWLGEDDVYFEDLTDEQKRAFVEHLRSMREEILSRGVDAPAYTHFSDAQQQPPGGWYVHFSRESFESFDRGATLENLHLSVHTRDATRVSCERNMSGDVGLFEIVYGFAYAVDEVDAYSASRNFGRSFMLFQTDCVVRAYHETDSQWQCVFPLCTEYNVFAGRYEYDQWWLENTDGELDSYESIEEVVEAVTRWTT